MSDERINRTTQPAQESVSSRNPVNNEAVSNNTEKAEKITKEHPPATEPIENKEPVKRAGAGHISKVFVVLNPVAGLTNVDTARDLVTAFCEEQGWECDLHETKKDEDLRQLVRDQIKQGVDLVIVSGGDGTVSAVVSGMAQSEVPMLIIPAGTGNALARDLNLPLNLEAAMELMRGHYTDRVLDVIEVKNGSKTDYFALNVSAGITAETMKDTKRNEKRRFGMFAYLFRAIGRIRKSRMHRYQVTVDGKLHRISASEVLIANTSPLGMDPNLEDVNIDPNDGRLDMFIVRAQGFRDYLAVLVEFILRKKSEDIEKMDYLEIRQTAEIKCLTPQPVQADGEVIGDTPVSIRMVPSALHIIAPGPDSSK